MAQPPIPYDNFDAMNFPLLFRQEQWTEGKPCEHTEGRWSFVWRGHLYGLYPSDSGWREGFVNGSTPGPEGAQARRAALRWHCHKCGSVHFRPTQGFVPRVEPAVVPARLKVVPPKDKNQGQLFK